eukprot:11258765-Alexandrium_andersonii.AAC.1
MLQASFRRARRSAPGADGWTPGELAHLPLAAAKALARMLMRIEQGALWPRQLSCVLCVHVAKAPGLALDPLKFRGSSIISTIY